MTSPRPLLVVLTGPSGAGKDSILARLKSLGRPYHFAVTATTRPPRQGERAGVDYHFVSPDEFQRMLEQDELLEHAEVYGHQYGVPRKAVREALRGGRDVILRTDVQGAHYIKSVDPDAVTIFVAPPSEAEMRRRLSVRGQDGEEQIALRMRVAEEEMKRASEFDHVVINDDLERCVREIEGILSEERGRPHPRVPA